MANTYFQFKKFTIHQDKCAMKVCTDSCLLGSTQPTTTLANQPILTILDVGTGTGLLSLMAAQLNINAKITAIEIEPNALLQASHNVANSIYKNNIVVKEFDFMESNTIKKYDLIISNPPFYNNQLKSNTVEKNMAHHSLQFSFSQFFENAFTQLQPKGILTILIPYTSLVGIVNIALQKQLHLYKIIQVQQTPQHQYFRSIVYFCTTKNDTINYSTISIKTNENEYSKAFETLLNPFYLNR